MKCNIQTYEQKRVQKTMRITYGLTLLTSFLSLTLLLAGCSTISETFDTKAVQGVGLKSISEVNAMVERGELRGLNTDTGVSANTAPLFLTQPPQNISVDEVQLSDRTLVYRQPEKHLRVWVAPFQGQSGNLHEGAVVHTLMHAGYWQMNPNPFYG